MQPLPNPLLENEREYRKDVNTTALRSRTKSPDVIGTDKMTKLGKDGKIFISLQFQPGAFSIGWCYHRPKILNKNGNGDNTDHW